MNIVLNPNDFKLSDLYCADKKRNVIIDGMFTKIIYSTDNVSIGGIYFNLNFNSISIINHDKEVFLKYNPSMYGNSNIINELTNIEYQILDFYRKINNLKINISTVLSRRLYSGNIKCHSMPNINSNQNINMIVKISGIWETVNEVGLAIKFIPIIV